MAQKDHYKTLGVEPTASAEDIKKSYRRLAKKYHPDVTGGDKSKEAKFKEISEAYEVLGDQKKRGEYDAVRNNPFFGREPGGGFGGGFPGSSPRGRGGSKAGGRIDLEDLFGGHAGFSDFFGEGFPGAGAGGRAGSRTTKRTQRGADLQTTVELTLPEAALGVEKALTLEPGVAPHKVTVRIPAGVTDGETIRVPGQGRPGARGGAAGDLLLQIKIQPHPRFRRAGGADLEVDVPIRLDEAVLGTKAEVPTLEGKVYVNIPPGTGSGLKLRLRGKGAGDRKGGRGDLFAVVQIQVPRQISEEARELMARFRDLTQKDYPQA